jgi:hypothetical protein
MAETKYSFEKECDSPRLTQEIAASDIIIALDRIERITTTDIWFKDELSSGDQTILSNLVTAHVNTPLPENEVKPVIVESLPEPQPFATPTYRTKLNATANILTVAPNTNAEIQYKLLEERYVTGGALIVKNAKLGDYITAEVEDVDAIIPAPYRAALCEAWPVISTYIEKNWVEVQGEYSIMKINTYPLNAKITPGLYLCLHYHAVNSGVDREIAVNYHLTKKL